MHLRLLFEIVHAEINPVGYSSYWVKIHNIAHRSCTYLHPMAEIPTIRFELISQIFFMSYKKPIYNSINCIL